METDEVLEQVEMPVEEPAETPEPETPAENVQEEQLEPQPEEEVVETPAPVAVPRPEIIINTGGLWKKFEEIVNRELEEGKTYNITFGVKCEVMISETEPTVGIVTTEIVYTKEANKDLWVKTGF